jgi:uncharacterized protein YfiM (DUF2279 family)
MDEISLAQAVEQFTQTTQGASEVDLARPWAWSDYDSEGVRFAHFRAYEELRALAVSIAHARAVAGRAPTQTQRILAQYHAAFCDMQAALIGLSAEDADRTPAEGEWPIRQVVAHMAGADIGFYVAIQHTLNRSRAGDHTPAPIPADVWEELIGLDEPSFDAVMSGQWADLLSYYQLFHQRILNDFSTIVDGELDMLAKYWENQPMPIRFRLGRFDSHLRQHTVQIDKTLIALGRAPSEAQQLLRLIYAALGEAEGTGIGALGIAAELSTSVAQFISAKAVELAAILNTR